MSLIGVEFMVSVARATGFSAEMVVNENGALFFAANLQHREQKAAGISYEDDYAGNALAAMLAPGQIEIRFHRAFSDQRVAQIIENLLAAPELYFMSNWQVAYQGRTIRAGEDRHGHVAP